MEYLHSLKVSPHKIITSYKKKKKLLSTKKKTGLYSSKTSRL